MSAKLTKEEFIAKYLKVGVSFQPRLKKQLLAFGIKEERCEECGITEWRGRPLQIQVHHINGNRNDNRIENLKMLCPNCHSQTENFQAKNTYVYEPREKVCVNCGKLFIARGDYQKCCSNECREEYHNKTRQEFKTSYTKEFLEGLCQKYSTLDEIGIILHKTRDTVKRYLVQHGLFEDFLRKRNLGTKPILQYNMDGTLIKEWPCITDAQETLKVYHIGLVCKGRRKSAGGFFWKFKEEESIVVNTSSELEVEESSPIPVSILQYDMEGNFLREFATIKEASESTSSNKTSIILCMQGKHKHANNYIWRYKEGEITQKIEVSDIIVTRTPILMLNTKGETLKRFQSIKEAANVTGISRPNINQCLRGVTQAAGGYIWKYENYSKKPLDEDIANRPIPTKLFQPRIKVLQYSLEGTFIREFDSMIEAAKETHTNHSKITECVKGNRNSTGGYMWRAKEGEDIPLQISPYKPNPSSSKGVLQYNTSGTFIEEYSSMEEVLKSNDISRGTLMKCLSGEKDSYKGYTWRYKNINS